MNASSRNFEKIVKTRRKSYHDIVVEGSKKKRCKRTAQVHIDEYIEDYNNVR